MNKLLSRKFLLFLLTFIVASLFCWFGKITGSQAIIVWLTVSIVYGLWNIIENKAQELTIKELKDLIEQIKDLINSKLC